MTTKKMYLLSFEEVTRLDEVLANVIQIHGRGNFPTLEVKPKEFIKLLTAKLNAQDFFVKDSRLNGSTASYVLNGQTDEHDADYTYNDLDLIFNVSLSSTEDFMIVKNSVLETLMDFLPPEVNKERISSCTMKEAYVKKMVKVTNKHDTWSLISLTNEQGCDIELKFVDSMKRKFEFSVDSFQIVLDSLLEFQTVSSEVQMSSTMYPSVEAESVYGDFEEARYHLRNKLIATKSPEEIRGGGLLKYCNLLCRDFQPVSDEIHSLEKYMCSRFFIDFKDITTQQNKLESYMQSHSLDSAEQRYKYLTILYDVVENSTVCLMGHERRQTLRMILDLTNQVFHPTNYQQITVFYSVPPYIKQSMPYSGINGNEFYMLGTWKTMSKLTGPSQTPKPVNCF